MKFDQYLKTWRGALAENKHSRYIILILVITNLVLAVYATSKTTTVVLVPPHLKREASLAENTADAGYKEAWATYVAMMLGNVTPKTAPYVSETVGKLMSPAVYRLMMDGITEQANRIATEQITVQFVPTQTFYNVEQDVVVVTGEYVIRGVQSAEQRSLRTYEIGIDVSDYTARVDSIKAYSGAWNAQREEAEKIEAEKRSRPETNSVQGEKK